VVERLAILPGPLGDRTTVVGTQVTSTAPVATGGTAPYTWSVTGPPAALSADAAGRVSGTVGLSPYTNVVTFTAHDAGGQVATRTITWTVPVVVPTVTGSPRTHGAERDPGGWPVDRSGVDRAQLRVAR
jgi:hypothetical protein